MVGAGGVGCAIAASLAAAGVAHLSLFDLNAASCQALAQRLLTHYPQLEVRTGDKDPAGFDLVVNATPEKRIEKRTVTETSKAGV